jgi:hypothetical protein
VQSPLNLRASASVGNVARIINTNGGRVVPKKNSKTLPAASFQIGDKVRVKHGFMDVDYPDMPLRGWAATVIDVQGADTFTVRWSKETMESIHPVVKQRCEIDGLDEDKYVLTGDVLEPDSGGPLDIEQPKHITSKSLSPKDPDDRIRMVFGLTSNDPLPDVDDDTLEVYHDHLSKNLLFPFTAEFAAKYGHPERVKVIGLGDSDEEPMIDDEYGILCEVRLKGQVVSVPLGELDDVKGKPNRQFVNDYCYWLHNWS